MNNLISVNRKFMDINPKELIELVLSSKTTKGIEIYINNYSEYEQEYLNQLVLELKQHNLLLQVHGNIEIDLKKQIEYINLLKKYSIYLGYPIVTTLYSVFDNKKEISIKKTVEYMNNLVNNIDSNSIIIFLENLNNLSNVDRLTKEDIKPIILDNKELYFTYDIGHEIIDGGMITNLDECIINKIRNVHIHTNDGQGNDHQPIYEKDKNWDDISKGLKFLINNKYEYNIVYEYDLYVCKGKNIKEKVIDYLSSIDYVTKEIYS